MRSLVIFAVTTPLRFSPAVFIDRSKSYERGEDTSAIKSLLRSHFIQGSLFCLEATQLHAIAARNTHNSLFPRDRTKTRRKVSRDQEGTVLPFQIFATQPCSFFR